MRRDVTVTRRTPSQTLLYFVSILMADSSSRWASSSW